jgi:hypothetical protein
MLLVTLRKVAKPPGPGLTPFEKTLDLLNN